LQRKKTGNLSVKSLGDVVTKEAFIEDSEYLETLLVAVPKNLTKEWQAKYERLTSMVVPRSANEITSDSDYTLCSVVIFKRTHDEFLQKCRENKFIVRDFHYDEQSILKQRQEMEDLAISEKDLWTDLLRLSRTNFSEAFQVLVHLKVVRLFVESVLRYGLPANYTGVIIKPDPKTTKRVMTTLGTQLSYLARRTQQSVKGKKTGGEEYTGEYQTLMEQEFYDYVLFEVPNVV